MASARLEVFILLCQLGNKTWKSFIYSFMEPWLSSFSEKGQCLFFSVVESFFASNYDKSLALTYC